MEEILVAVCVIAAAIYCIRRFYRTGRNGGGCSCGCGCKGCGSQKSSQCR
ncbi:MAG TPA: FeoB-associated Cys-rich membrane protein [Candidatus Avidesulfovibrio excrementigallinarum]|nr:FeoB-associated Cys-rich membrane protein [Candidatus Avidesulfovibrio excrementigallinarum]